MRIYLDGAAKPAVDLPFRDYFSMKNRPFVYPSLVHDTASGANSYVPIPYQKSCKIVAEKGWGELLPLHLHHFPKDTMVPTFKREPDRGRLSALTEADKNLTTGLGTDPAGIRAGETTRTAKLSVAPGNDRLSRFAQRPRRDHRDQGEARSEDLAGPASGRSRCESAGTARRSPACGARSATSSAPRPASTCTSRFRWGSRRMGPTATGICRSRRTRRSSS